MSELQRRAANPRVRELVESIRVQDLFLSVITIGELTKGIALLSSGKKKDALSRWLLALEQENSNRILAVDQEAARIWGELTARTRDRGKVVAVANGLIAATAMRRAAPRSRRGHPKLRHVARLQH